MNSNPDDLLDQLEQQLRQNQSALQWTPAQRDRWLAAVSRRGALFGSLAEANASSFDVRLPLVYLQSEVGCLPRFHCPYLRKGNRTTYAQYYLEQPRCRLERLSSMECTEVLISYFSLLSITLMLLL